MQINVSELLKAPIGTTQEHEINETVDVTGNSSEKAVQGKVSLLRTDRCILVRGALHTEVELSCSRCLSLFSHSVTLNIEEEYLPTIDMVSGTPLPSPEEPAGFTIDEHQIIDLTEAVRQQTLLAIPIKPLCREDCAGLCQNCGHNLNLGPCDCLPQSIDPRWAKLSKLIHKQA